jgi:hypothetical protein
MLFTLQPILTNLSFPGKRVMSSDATDYTWRRGDFFAFHNISPTRWAAQETHMPIRLVVTNSEISYLATDAGILINAFEAALNELGLVDRHDPAALVVANHIVTFAKAGVLDPVRLCDLTVKEVRKVAAGAAF